MPPHPIMQRQSIWCWLRRASKWGEFEAAVTPIFHRGTYPSAWGPVPVGLSDESKQLHLRRLKLFFFAFLRDECTQGERIVADVFRRHITPPPHISLAEMSHLESTGSWEVIVETIEQKAFEKIPVPDVDRIDLPAISFVAPTASALERLMWLGLNPDQYCLDPNPPKRSRPKPEMARDRRLKRHAAKAEAHPASSTKIRSEEPPSQTATVVPMGAPSKYAWKRSRRER